MEPPYNVHEMNCGESSGSSQGAMARKLFSDKPRGDSGESLNFETNGVYTNSALRFRDFLPETGVPDAPLVLFLAIWHR
jgi:hypothetical protein